MDRAWDKGWAADPVSPCGPETQSKGARGQWEGNAGLSPCCPKPGELFRVKGQRWSVDLQDSIKATNNSELLERLGDSALPVEPSVATRTSRCEPGSDSSCIGFLTVSPGQ